MQTDPVAARPPEPLGPVDRARALVERLRVPDCYFHPAGHVALLETHISFVLLAGPFAYKIKKPVNLGFLDYTTLEARRRYCEDEVRLNRRTAPDIYLGVVPITGTPDHPLVGGTGPAIEYAVRMRRFPEEGRLDHVAAAGGLEPHHIDALALEIARLHEGARWGSPQAGLGSPEQALASALDNFRAIRALGGVAGEVPLLARLQEWTAAEHHAVRETMLERQRSGYVRECHGDLHLGNVVLIDGRPVLFDCIEFNAAFRWIDVMSDVAFVVMDLHEHGRADLAARLLNAYLDRTADYGGLKVLRFYLVYRAMVRAKVSCIRAHQAGVAERERTLALEEFHRYLSLAQDLSLGTGPGLVLMHGFSGSGKSTVAAVLAERLGAIRLRSDLVRKVLHGIAPEARTHSGVGEGLYGRGAGERTYLELGRRAQQVLRAGYPVIVDATFLEMARRRRLRDLAALEAAPVVIVDCIAPVAVLRERVAERARRAEDISEAGLEVLEAQLRAAEPFEAAEREASLTCDTSRALTASLIAELLFRLLGRTMGKPCATSTSSTAMPTDSARSTS